MDLGQKNLRDLKELCYVGRFGFYAPKLNCLHVPEWLRRRVVTCDKTQTRTWIHEPSVALDPKHRVLASGAPPL
jgi:hypothetical protein